jgi:hypothetical protein
MMNTRILSYAWVVVPVMWSFALGIWYGRKQGRAEEYEKWCETVVPELKRLECERDTLWRSAVSKNNG